MERGFNDDADFPAHDALARELAAARRRRADAYEVLEEQDPVALELDYAQALKVSMDNHEGVEKLLNTAMARRNDVLKQLDRYRNGLAQPLRQASDEMIAGEFAAVESSAPEIDAPLLALEEQEEEERTNDVGRQNRCKQSQRSEEPRASNGGREIADTLERASPWALRRRH